MASGLKGAETHGTWKVTSFPANQRTTESVLASAISCYSAQGQIEPHHTGEFETVSFLCSGQCEEPALGVGEADQQPHLARLPGHQELEVLQQQERGMEAQGVCSQQEGGRLQDQGWVQKAQGHHGTARYKYFYHMAGDRKSS